MSSRLSKVISLPNYEKNGQTICDYIDSTPGVKVKSSGRIINREYYFKEGITWSKVSSKSLSFRYVPKGYIFDVAGTSIFFGDSAYRLCRNRSYARSKFTREFPNMLL